MSSPEGEKLEQSLLDASATADYIGRRPSSSGRDTKRISQSPNIFTLFRVPLMQPAVCLDARASVTQAADPVGQKLDKLVISCCTTSTFHQNPSSRIAFQQGLCNG